MNGRLRHTLVGVVLTLALAAAAACTSSSYEATPLPSPSATAKATPSPSPSPSTAAPTCTNPLQSYTPPATVPTNLTGFKTVQRIKDRGRLIVGVSADTLLLAARNPVSGRIHGFDIDMARLISAAIFGNADQIELRVITTAQRIPVLQDNSVDLVVRNMTINCARWEQVAFSAEYYLSGQKVLVPLSSTATSLADLSGQRVCAPTGSTSIDNIDRFPKVVAVGAATHTGCLVKFQQGEADAITGDDTVLAGLAAQDPYAKVVGRAFTAEPYGIAANQDAKDLVMYVNAVLARATANGAWKAAYDRWLAADLGPAPAPPTPVYGRR